RLRWARAMSADVAEYLGCNYPRGSASILDMSVLEGTPSDDAPAILATGHNDIGVVFVSMSGRHPEGRDADYLQWHSLDHRPEQYRLAALRSSVRIVSTPACRAARAASDKRFDATDHVMTYLFKDASLLSGF